MLPTFDIEALNWVKPIAVGFFDGIEYKEFIKEDDEDDVLWRFLSHIKENCKGIRLYGHYASRYDNKLLLACLCQHDEKVNLEMGLAKLKWVVPDVTFEDSYLLVPMSLKKMTATFEVEQKGVWDHGQTRAPWEMGEGLQTFRDYLRTDCMSLSWALDKVCEELGTYFSISPSVSLATTAAKAFNKGFYELRNVEANEDFETFIRQATFGGRNEVYKRYGEDINQYDIKSMYVSCYDVDVPIGKLHWDKATLEGPGTIGEARVSVPKDWYVGPLPKRLGERLVFPVGEFEGLWDIRELKNAAAKGVDVSIRRKLTADEAPILKGFGVVCSRLRGGKSDSFWKLFGLALSGKLGQNRWRDVIRYYEEIGDGNMNGYYPVEVEELYFQTKEYAKKMPYIKPAISMRIRAEARVRHFNCMMKAKEEGDIFYCDTDSIFTTSELTTGQEVGDLIFLGKGQRGYFIKQKLYAIIQDEGLKQRSAGYSDLKLTEKDFQDLLAGREILLVDENLGAVKTVLKDKEVSLVVRWRTIKGEGQDNRIPIGQDTRPVCLPQDLILYSNA